MNIRSAIPEDAEKISNLIMHSTSAHKHDDFDDAGWLRFSTSNSENGVLAKLQESERVTSVAEDAGHLLGVISITGGEKIDLLFVCPNQLRKGVGSQLWKDVLNLCSPSGRPQRFWVRSSSAGVPFYESLGFEVEGGRQTISGISFYFMRLSARESLTGINGV